MVLVLSSQPFRIFPFAFVYLLIDIINLQAVLFVFDLTKYIFFAQNLSMCAKDHLVFRDEKDHLVYRHEMGIMVTPPERSRRC